ncbi:HDOD domain-containing protein [Planctomycetota bacterium]
MTVRRADLTGAQEVELAIAQIDSLRTLPSVALQLLPLISHRQFSPSSLADIIESDAALSAKIFSLINSEGITLPESKMSPGRALDKLPAHLVQEAILSVDVFDDFAGLETQKSQQEVIRKELALHNLAVACAAGDIAEAVSGRLDSKICYIAGLLHDIGKLAIDKVMPKSFVRIAEEAKSQGASFSALEQEYLGIDHTIIGKRLAQKWHFPKPVMLAIWLHHSNTEAVSEKIPEAKIAQVVQLADYVAHRSGIGLSGGYDETVPPEQTIQSLGITNKQLEQILEELGEQVDEKSKLIGLDLPNAVAAYSKAAHQTSVRLVRDKAKIQLEHEQLQTASSHFEFTKDFLAGVDSSMSALDIARRFAVSWQKFYQTGPVCLYMRSSNDSKQLATVLVEKLAESKVTYLKAPSNSPAIPSAIAGKFEILNAGEYLNWLFEQVDVEFDIKYTKALPLLSGKNAVGVLVFELRYPVDVELFRDKFQTSASVAAVVLDMALSSLWKERFAEALAYPPAKRKKSQQQPPSPVPLSWLAEMAAGAAHELNNPLSVISGRLQLIADGEEDEEKKKILLKIQENSDEIAEIIEDLMSFAEPRQPRPANTDVKQILDEAIQLTVQRTSIEELDIQPEFGTDVQEVFVDSAQFVSSIANIFSNALESYPKQSGPIEVIADMDIGGESVRLQITDHGCGMDAGTVERATRPFFSARPAGRKRGMGLAYAERHIQLNGGSLSITSEPGRGTTVTILLPCK